MRALAAIVAVLLVLAHPAAVADACHVILAAELAAVTVIAVAVARAAGVCRYWRLRRWTPWTP
jgi:hypothetical protein